MNVQLQTGIRIGKLLLLPVRAKDDHPGHAIVHQQQQ